MLECLKKIIGLSDIDCPCVEGERPEDYNESASGYFLTDYIPINTLLFSEENCYCGRPIWELMQKCIDTACKRFCIDLTACIYNDNKFSKLARFSGEMGKTKSNGTKSNCKKYAGFCFKIKKTIKGGFLHIPCIRLGLNRDCEVELNIKNCQTGDIKTVVVNVEAGKFTQVDLGFDAQMSCDDKYKIWYEVPQGCKPLNNKLHCCSKSESKTPCLKYVDLGGFTTDDIEDCKCKDNAAYGIQVDGFLKCEDLYWICSLEKIGEYKLLDVVAQTILFKASIEFVYKMLNAGGVSSFMLLEGERAYKEMSKWRKNYETNLEFIKQNIPLDLTDCLSCNKNRRGRKKKLW